MSSSRGRRKVWLPVQSQYIPVLACSEKLPTLRWWGVMAKEHRLWPWLMCRGNLVNRLPVTDRWESRSYRVCPCGWASRNGVVQESRERKLWKAIKATETESSSHWAKLSSDTGEDHSSCQKCSSKCYNCGESGQYANVCQGNKITACSALDITLCNEKAHKACERECMQYYHFVKQNWALVGWLTTSLFCVTWCSDITARKNAGSTNIL